MPVDLAALVAPAHTAVVTMELQRGVVGDLAAMRDLADEVDRQGVIANTARLLRAARAAGARVVHCTAQFRSDKLGSSANAPLLSRMLKLPDHLLVGSAGAEVVPELGPEESDVVSARLHGLSPLVGTDLDALLRAMGVDTIVVTGVSVNLGVLGLCIEAVDAGYRVVLATDAVAGVPTDYAEAVIRNTLALVATRARVDEIAACWEPTTAN